MSSVRVVHSLGEPTEMESFVLDLGTSSKC